jgi:hypothetical protein
MMADIGHVAHFDEQVAGDFALHAKLYWYDKGATCLGSKNEIAVVVLCPRGTAPNAGVSGWRENAGKPSRRRNTLWNSA